MMAALRLIDQCAAVSDGRKGMTARAAFALLYTQSGLLGVSASADAWPCFDRPQRIRRTGRDLFCYAPRTS
jgi:hypothetical protein